MHKLIFKNGDAMPAFGLGTWLSGQDEVKQAVLDAIRAGYRHIDCALIYGNETEVGEALAELFAEGTVKREELWITSKLWNNSHTPQDVLPQIEQTLHDLRLTYLDLYLIHWPVSLKRGVKFPQSMDDLVKPEDLPMQATWHAMEELQRKGLTRHIGVSNFSIRKIKEIMADATIMPEMNQVEIHPHFQQKEMVEFCHEHQIHLTAYAPLGCGYRPITEAAPVLGDEVILQIAASHHATPAQVVLAWGMQRGYSVIPKSVKAERIISNFGAEKLTLTAQEMESINQIDLNIRFTTGDLWTKEGSPYTQESLWN